MKTDIEFEGKVIEIDVQQIKKLLLSKEAELVGEYLQKRYVFNTIPFSESRWIRLRTNGEKATLAVKEIGDDSIEGTEEWEVIVSDFEKTLMILEKIGVKAKGYQENRRIEYRFDNCSVTIDIWPKIPPYLEIEGDSKESVENCAQKLNINPSKITGINTKKVYTKYGIDIDKIKELKF